MSSQDEIVVGNVARLVNRLSRDLSFHRSSEVTFRRGVGPLKTANVRYSYKAAQDDELDLEVDDVLDVIEDAEPGWMKGKNRTTGRIGFFPSNFVNFTDNLPQSGNGFYQTSGGEKKNPEAIQRISSADTTKARDNSVVAAVETKKFDSDSDVCSSTAIDLVPEAANTQKDLARVLFTYTPSHQDELLLEKVGMIITIVSKDCPDPGWFMAEIDGKRGLIPENFVKLLETPSNVQDSQKTHSPPSVPVKPVKPPGLGISSTSNAARRPGTMPSSAFAAMHTTLADALTKPPKTFVAKASKGEEGNAEVRSEERLSHITINRPKQPNKRPPSTYLSKNKLAENVLELSFTEELGTNTSLASSTSPAACSPSLSSVSMQQNSILQTSVSPSGIKTEKSQEDFVSRAEFNQVIAKLDEIERKMNERISSLEAKLNSLL